MKDPAPQQIFVVHGDAQVTEIFANTLREKGLPAHAPLYEEVFDLARNVMLAAGVEIAPKKTSFASTGRPSTAYHELGAGRHGSAVHHPGQQGRRQQGPEEDGSTAQGSYREMEGRLSGRSVWDRRAVPFGWTVRLCIPAGLPGRGRGGPQEKGREMKQILMIGTGGTIASEMTEAGLVPGMSGAEFGHAIFPPWKSFARWTASRCATLTPPI